MLRIPDSVVHSFAAAIDQRHFLPVNPTAGLRRVRAARNENSAGPLCGAPVIYGVDKNWDDWGCRRQRATSGIHVVHGVALQNSRR